MPHPYAWKRLTQQGEADQARTVTPRAGHTLTLINGRFIMYGGMDGRRNDQSNPAPNSDLFELKLGTQGTYEWALFDLDHSSQVPPVRTLHSAIHNGGDEIIIFGGIHSAIPYQCLQDAWYLDVKCNEWKKVHFRAAPAANRGSMSRRMTGLIQDRMKDEGARRKNSSGRRRSARASMSGGPKGSVQGSISFASLAGAATRAVHEKRASIRGTMGSSVIASTVAGGSKKWRSVLQKKMGSMLAAPRGGGMRMRKPGSQGMSGNLMATSEEQFHDELIAMVSQTAYEDPSAGAGPDVVIPAPRSNHTMCLHESSAVLIGGHGGAGFSRKAFNDVWVLNPDNFRWQELNCQGTAPAPRSGHEAFAKDGQIFVFGGWNNESQFNDLFMLDLENKDWNEVDLLWDVPRWNMSLQLVEAIPSWRVFVFGGTADITGDGRCAGQFDNRIGVLDLCEQLRWDDPKLENGENDVLPMPREHSAICYEREESRLIIFGGWANKWLDDVWQINVSSIVGPPYAIIKVDPPLGPVTGNMKVTVYGVGFESTSGMIDIEFSTGSHSAMSQGNMINNEIIECLTPSVVSTIGPNECQVRVRIGVRDFTTTVTNYTYFLNAVAEKSLCFGPGVLQDQQANTETRFMIQCRNKNGENRKSGRDEFVISVQQRVQTEDGKETMRDLPFELTDLDNGQYEVKYTAGDGEVVIQVKLIDEQNKPRPLRGSPFKPTFTSMARNKANEYTGPLVSAWIQSTLKSLQEFWETTNTGHQTKLKDGDVMNLIKVMNHIKDMYTMEDTLILKQDEIVETLAILDKEGIPGDKHLKQLKKAGANLVQLKEDIIAKQKDIQPMQQKESDLYRKTIQAFEGELKEYKGKLKKEDYYCYKKGLERAEKRLSDVTNDLDKFDATMENYNHIATNFQYPEELAGSRKTMQDMRQELTNMKALWDFEVNRIKATEEFLVQKWTQVDPNGMDDDIKALYKKLKEVGAKVDRKCDAYVGMQEVLKKWTVFCPLVGELRNDAMRSRHWVDLMELCGKQIQVTPDLLLRDMWNLELTSPKMTEAVEEKTDQAKQEARMENLLKKLGKEWAEVNFDFEAHKGSDAIMRLKISDEKFEMLEDHQTAVQNMFASRFLSTFEDQVLYWQKTLANIYDVSTLISEVQRSWAFLENLFIYSDEVKKELPEDSDRFVGIDMDVKEILRNGFEIKLCKDFCNQGNISQKLEGLQSQLEDCQKALNEFMEGKRRMFPRFYFMSAADLLDVLSNGNSPSKVVPKFPLFFIAIDNYDIQFPNGDTKQRPIATAMNACVGEEHVPFPEELPLVGKVEVYLDKCIEWFRMTLRHYSKQDRVRYFTDGCMDDGDKRGQFIADSQASQCGLLVQLITWVLLVEGGFQAEQSGTPGVKDAWDKQAMLLQRLIVLTMTKLSKPVRRKVMCAITLDAHNRDVQARLFAEKVTSKDEFQWQSMLKCYWLEDVDDASMQICDAKFPYGYEYLGNGPRLVVTPLTDRIYVTATQALHLCMGCAPAGPAGTGKTESTKDLANAVAKACYVINAAPEMDYLTLGDIYKGLSASGSWGCFDEFNRLKPEVLSVCTVQFKSVCDAVKAKAKRFVLQGAEISLDPAVGCFITMNPGYLGRSELPEGLKALFRPITVMVPDFQLIIENMFMGEGFQESQALGLKFATLYALNKDLLSASKKYDWGMRAIKSVLVVAGTFKRADPELGEQAVLMRSLRDTNVAKIDGDDLRIFMGLLGDLFPGINVPRARDYEMEGILVDVMQKDYGFTHDPGEYLLLKIAQLIELLGIRHCVFLMGNPGTFKTAMWKILKNAKTRRGEKTTVVDFSPKAITTNELYGFVNMATREWKDGILSKTMRDLGQVPDLHPKWILLDGDLDANWIESMNSVMDDNRLLTLPSNERIPLKAHMKMIFEIRDLNYATPATATRAGIVVMSDEEGVQWRSYVSSWARKLTQHPETVGEQLVQLFERYGKEALFWMYKNTKKAVPIYDIALIMACCSLLDYSLKPAYYEPVALEYLFVFCFIASVGCCLSEIDGKDYRKEFSTWWKAEMKSVKFPSTKTVFDYFVKEARLEEWSSAVETLTYSSDIPMGEVTVPTGETVSMTFFMKALIYQQHPVMLIGAAGCGKTQSVFGLLKSLPTDKFAFHPMNMSYYTDSTLLQAMMENPLVKKSGKLFGPPGNLQLVYFIDDLNMPMLDTYNTQSAIEIMKQKQDYGHWYDRSKIVIKEIGNTQYVSCMNPTAGSFTINQRLQRHFWTCSVMFPEIAALTIIYETFMKGHFSRLPFKQAIQDNIPGVIKAALNLHENVAKTFRKTAANFHYEFNIRHLSGVFGGLLSVKPTEFPEALKLILLWIHESERVYGDRLVSVSDLKKYRGLAKDLSSKMFSQKFSFQEFFKEKNPELLVFAPFSKGITEMDGGGTYDKIANVEKLSDLLQEALKEYNDNNPAMDLVLFNDAMCHVARITRILCSTPGHPLLVGVGGSGRQSLARLSGYICQYDTRMIVISGSYGNNELKADLQTFQTKAGIKDEGLQWLFTDGQITKERFLVFINDLLASGDIADLYAPEDKDVIKNGVRGACKASGKQDTPENLWSFFIARIRKNLHMTLAFSPVGDMMRSRARKFPALVNCTVIDWFQPWPMDALFDVGRKFLSPIVQLGPQDSPVRSGILDFLPYSFESSGQQADIFMATERRYAYATPKSFLELIKLYTSMVGKKVDQLEDQKDRLTNGLEKLRATQEQVAGLEVELSEQAVVVQASAEAADKFAAKVAADKEIVDMESKKAEIEEKNSTTIAAEVKEQKSGCENDLAAAVPLVEEAKKALDVLDKKDFQELKSLAKPPGGVDLVCEATAHLQATLDSAIEVDKKGVIKDPTWKGSVRMMNSPERFLQNLKDYGALVDDGKVPPQNVERARKIQKDMGESFTYEIMFKKSQAAAGLVVWVINIIKYYDVVVTVEPKRQALRQAEETLAAAEAKKKEAQEIVRTLNEQLGVLKSQLAEAIAKKEEVMATAAKCQNKLDMAKRLVGALSANGSIWESTVARAGEELVYIPGDTLVACSFASYVGVFTRKYRETVVENFTEYLRKNNVPLGPKPDPLGILASDADIATWAGQGLPSDLVSCQNGAILTNSQRWCLIIDPQLQGIVWIKKKEEDNNLQVTRLPVTKQSLNIFETSLDQGKSVLIENMGEVIDAVLMPVVSRNFITRGKKRLVKVGDKEIIFHQNFKLFMQTKLSNPHYPPEVQAETTVINFTVTEDGLEDQILFLVVRLERPDLARSKTELIQQQNEFKVTLAQLEAMLLEKLSSAEGDILENTELILNLEEAKKTADEVKEKAVKAQKTEKEINETSEFYRPAGIRGSLLFFLMMDLCKMHTFYKYSLDSFVMVVTRAVNSITLRKPKEKIAAPKEEEEPAEKDEDEEGDEEEGEEEEEEEEEEEIVILQGKDLIKRVTHLEGVITSFVFNYTRRGLLDADKLTVVSMMCFKVLERSRKITPEELKTLIVAPPDPAPPPMTDNVKSYLSEIQWAQMKSLENLEAFKKGGAITQNLDQDAMSWKRWCSDNQAETSDLPRGVRDIGPFHRMFLLRILRQDRLGAALTQFVIDNLGQDYVEQPPFDMESTYVESTAVTPFFFVLFPGVDPTSAIEGLGKKLGITESNGRLKNISMGQGQEKVAIKALNDAAKDGGWVALQNIHLMQEWLKDLERQLEIIEDFAHDEFRCFLTSEPPGPMQGRLWDLIPEPILQRCIKVADEAPTDLKSNLRRAYSKFSQEQIDACMKPKEFKAILFALCMFHALISGRIKFGAQGWSKKYPFNDGDLTICGTVTKNYLNNADALGTDVPWPDLRYIFGQIMYGGHITDQWDRRVDVTYLEVLVIPDLLQGMTLVQGLKSPDPTKNEYVQYVKIIEDKFPPEVPQMYGLHPNAEIGFLNQQGISIFRTIAEVSGGSAGGGGGDISAATEYINSYLSQLPQNLDMIEIRSRLKPEDYTPFVIVSLQESECINGLLSTIRESLLELELGIGGALNVTDAMEQLAKDLGLGKVTARWADKAYASLKPLAGWFVDLLERVTQVVEWTKLLSLLKSIWMSGLFKPMSFLTSNMQVAARKNSLPLDFMRNRCRFYNTTKVDDVPGLPPQGANCHGLFLEGAGWEEGKNDEEGYVAESKMKDLHPQMPVFHVYAVHQDEMDWNSMYHCPVFMTAARGGTYIFTANLRMDPDELESTWILAGVAMLTQAED